MSTAALPTPSDPAAAPGTPLVVRSVPLEDPGPLLALLPAGLAASEVVSWVRRGEGLVGWGVAAECRTRGPQRFAEAQDWWSAVAAHASVRDEVGLPGSGAVVFGSFPFADDSAEEARLVVPAVTVGRRGSRWWVTTAYAGAGASRLPVVAPAPAPEAPYDVAFADGAQEPVQWAGSVAEAVRRINRGDVDKVVLARDLLAVARRPVDARWVLQQLAARYDTTWTFAVGGLVGATPELLVRRDQGLVTSRVLAGTIRRTGDDVKDLALAGGLARSSKDLEEHEYAVRSVADALAPHCSSMNVPESPFVLHLSNVMHLATDVTGVSADAVSSLGLAASLHPSAAVGGTPTAEAVALIAELEGMDRGRYAGPVGWMDRSGDGEWGIALRCGRIDDDDPRAVRLYAGCGIVAGSVPEAEVAESDAKLVPMRDALTATAS
ncbi:isochorismate synthase [Lapillicoccus jejuensis]|uniref:isochorismate synthase n=1 Tax=Lapillicoccus jejuensis TaxID=402171 RepID=A0A542DX33_9MICO|nr:isochorismate synthase [Lapillicoccus jejuensis]TQJ07647.1 isochorismate synthase [Lapillicoccus jejuensis]